MSGKRWTAAPGRAWRWFARNVREPSESEPVSIELERNREAAVELGAENPPDVPLFRFRLGLRAGFSGERRACIPVFRRVNPDPHPVLKEIFFCEVAGSMLEAANVHALLNKTARMIEGLAPAKSLPLAYFTVPAMDYSLPLYEDRGQVVCPVIAGPKLRAPNLAEMRSHVCRYLLNAGYVSDASQVEIRVVRPSDLKLVPPAGVVASLDDPDLWYATVEGHSPEGLVIGLLGEATELRPAERQRAGSRDLASPPAAADIASLLRLIGSELAEGGRLDDPFALYAREVRPEIWARTEELTDDLGRKLSCWLEGDEPARLELPLRRTAAGELLTALEDQGICVFVASEEPDLGQRVGRYLSRHGFLRWEDTVEVVPSEEKGTTPEADGGWRSGETEFSRLEFGGWREQPLQAAQAPEGEASGAQALENQKQKEEVGLP